MKVPLLFNTPSLHIREQQASYLPQISILIHIIVQADQQFFVLYRPFSFESFQLLEIH
jgi:hypothetical protein